MPHGAAMYCNHEDVLTPCLLLPNYMKFYPQTCGSQTSASIVNVSYSNQKGVLDKTSIAYCFFFQPSVAMEKRHVNGQLPAALHLFFTEVG